MGSGGRQAADLEDREHGEGHHDDGGEEDRAGKASGGRLHRATSVQEVAWPVRANARAVVLSVDITAALAAFLKSLNEDYE